MKGDLLKEAGKYYISHSIEEIIHHFTMMRNLEECKMSRVFNNNKYEFFLLLPWYSAAVPTSSESLEIVEP
jgi:hypothetical protein